MTDRAATTESKHTVILCGECWLSHDSVVCTHKCEDVEQPETFEDKGVGVQKSLF